MRITIGRHTRSTAPNTDVSHGPRNGLRHARGFPSPGGRCRSNPRHSPAGNPYGRSGCVSFTTQRSKDGFVSTCAPGTGSIGSSLPICAVTVMTTGPPPG